MHGARSIPLSALQHYLFCPRQCALIHNEQLWAENHFTAEGQALHKKANEGPDEHRAACTILRHLYVSSEKYGIHGICDVVEKQKDQYRPVEYKRGKPKAHRADEVQLCAQAICLEETFGCEVRNGVIFYGKTRRRTEVDIDAELRKITMDIIAKTADLLITQVTPVADYRKSRCASCSLLGLCMPRHKRHARSAADWFTKQLESSGPTLSGL